MILLQSTIEILWSIQLGINKSVAEIVDNWCSFCKFDSCGSFLTKRLSPLLLLFMSQRGDNMASDSFSLCWGEGSLIFLEKFQKLMLKKKFISWSWDLGQTMSGSQGWDWEIINDHLNFVGSAQWDT